MSKILRVFMDADLRCSHDGLAVLCKKEKVDLNALQPGEYLIFINSARDRIKLWAANGVLAYLRLERGKIDLKTIALIPQAFQGSGRIDYDKALKQVLMKGLKL